MTEKNTSSSIYLGRTIDIVSLLLYATIALIGHLAIDLSRMGSFAFLRFYFHFLFAIFYIFFHFLFYFIAAP